MVRAKDIALGKAKCYFIKPQVSYYDYQYLSLKSLFYKNVILMFTSLKLTDSARSGWLLCRLSFNKSLLEAHESQVEQHSSLAELF